jgi:hypothetical protein
VRRSLSSPACLKWQPKPNNKRSCTPMAFLLIFLQHNPCVPFLSLRLT